MRPASVGVVAGLRYYSSGLGRWTNRDPLEENGGVALYCFCTNAPSMAVDLRGESVLDILMLMPVFGTLYNMVARPPGSRASHYRVFVDPCECKVDQAIAVAHCMQGVSTQEAAYTMRYAGLNIAHEVIDAFVSIRVPAFLIDAAVDFLVSLYRIDQIAAAAETARRGCVCP